MTAGVRHRLGAHRAPLQAAIFLMLVVGTLARASDYSHGEPTDYEQLMLELINEARANPSAEAARLQIGLNDGLTAGRIDTAAKQPLAFHPQLIQAARAHSDWMLSADVFSHTGSGGSTPSDRAEAAGYSYGVGENIAYQSSSGALDVLAATHSNHDGLFISPGHRTNLMDPGYTVIGLGIREGQFDGWNAQMVSQSFSAGGDSVDSGPFLLGVVFDDKNGNDRYDPGEGLEGVRVEPDYGGYSAVTSASGGYAVPLPPGSALTETVRLPFAVGSASWEDVRPYDEDYRQSKVADASDMTLRITWSGQAIGKALTSATTIKRPVRVNYNLLGTDNAYYSRTLVAAENVKLDFLLQDPPPVAPEPTPGNSSGSSATGSGSVGGGSQASTRAEKSRGSKLKKSKKSSTKKTAERSKKSKKTKNSNGRSKKKSKKKPL